MPVLGELAAEVCAAGEREEAERAAGSMVVAKAVDAPVAAARESATEAEALAGAAAAGWVVNPVCPVAPSAAAMGKETPVVA